MNQQGYKTSYIAETLKIDRETVRRWAKSSAEAETVRDEKPTDGGAQSDNS